MTTGSWNPIGAASFITLSWDYNGAALAANDWITVNLKLAVGSAIANVTSLTFDILITASG
jgi:hypothetical protein